MTLATKFFLDRYEKKTFFYGLTISCTMQKMRKMTDTFMRMLDFNFYIKEDEYKNAERHIMLVVSNGIRAIGLIPIFQKDRDLAETKERAKAVEREKSSHKESIKPATPPEPSRKEEQICPIVVESFSSMKEVKASEMVEELQMAKL